MRERELLALFILAAGGLGGCQTVPAEVPAPAAPPAATALAGSPAEAPEPGGFLAFCLRMPDQCQATPGRAVADLTPRTWDMLQRVNHAVNLAIAPEADLVHYDRQEYWTIPADGHGDCEDYALAKRKALAEAGLPPGALRVAIVLSPENTLHAVLTVTTDRGDYYLDNLSDAVRPWSDSPYRWIERQDGAQPWRWVSLLPDDDRRIFAMLGGWIMTGSID